MKQLFLQLLLLLSISGFSQLSEYNDPSKFSKSINEKFVTELNGKPISFYLNHNEIDDYSKLYYQGKFAVSDDSLTFAFLDSVLTQNGETRPFYLFVFNSVLSKSDGSLAEYISEDCFAYFEKYPCKFLGIKDDVLYSKNYEHWINYAAFAFFPEGETTQQIEERFTRIESTVSAMCRQYRNEYFKVEKIIREFWIRNK